MNPNIKKIESTVFGATGLIGSRLIPYLRKDLEFKKIHLATRSPINIRDEKIKVHEINLFKKFEILNSLKKSKVVFITIGTTMSRVKGDHDEYKRIDFGRLSKPTIVVAPVVVIPETDSKIASLTLSPKK